MKEKKVRKRDKENSQTLFLNAALELFSKQGYDGTTTKQIAAKAKLNESLISRYFKGKEGLFFAVIERFYHQVAEDFPPLDANLSIAEELKDHSYKIMEQTYENRLIFKVVISRSLSDVSFARKMHGLMKTNRVFLDRLLLLNSKSAQKISDDEIETSIFVTEVMLGLTVSLHDVLGLDKEETRLKLRKFIDLYCDRVLPNPKE